MISFSEYQEQDWTEKTNELIRRAGYMCEECDLPATTVHICYHTKNRRIWEYSDDAYKCYCQHHLEFRRRTEVEVKKTLAKFSTVELDPLQLVMEKMILVPNHVRERSLFQLYEFAKKLNIQDSNDGNDEDKDEYEDE